MWGLKIQLIKTKFTKWVVVESFRESKNAAIALNRSLSQVISKTTTNIKTLISQKAWWVSSQLLS
jgi:hypothetical protein